MPPPPEHACKRCRNPAGADDRRAQVWTCDTKSHKIDLTFPKNQDKSSFGTLFFCFSFFFFSSSFGVVLLLTETTDSWNFNKKKKQNNGASVPESPSGIFIFTNCSLWSWPEASRASDLVCRQVLVLDQELLCHCVSSCLDFCKATSGLHYSVVEHTDHSNLSTFSHT